MARIIPLTLLLLAGCAAQGPAGAGPAAVVSPIPEPPLALQVHGLVVERDGARGVEYVSETALDALPAVDGGSWSLIQRLQIPPAARDAVIDGAVAVTFVVEADGRVTEVEVLRSVHEAVDAHAVEELKQTRFTPARLEGAPVALKVATAFRFRANAPERDID